MRLISIKNNIQVLFVPNYHTFQITMIYIIASIFDNPKLMTLQLCMIFNPYVRLLIIIAHIDWLNICLRFYNIAF